MLRKLLPFLPFMLPFIIYAVWVIIAPRLNINSSWSNAPWFFLFIISILFFILTMISLSFIDGSDIGLNYVSPFFENGKIVPGTFVEPKKP